MSNIPPIQFEMGSPSATPEKEMPRVWIGWALIVLIFGFLIAGAFSQASGKKLVDDKAEKRSSEKMIQLMLAARALPGAAPRTVPQYESFIDDLLVDAKTSATAQKLRVALRVEDGQKPFADDLKNLAKSGKPNDAAFVELYQTEKIKKPEAEALVAKLKDDNLGEKLAKVQFKEKFGDKEIRQKTFPIEPVFKFGIVGLVGCSGFLIGFALLAIYISRRGVGDFRPLGMPQDMVQPWKADRLALGAGLVMLSYIIGGTISELIDKPFTRPLPFVMIAGCLVMIGRVPLAGHQFTFADLGIDFRRLGQKIGWGIAGSFCMIPILALALIVAAALVKALPGGAHPIGEEMLHGTTVSKFLITLLLASVVAPIWEEFMFRGLLFPALSGVFKNRIWGAVASSFLFAAIHPQGPAGVPILMTIALGLCYMSYQTKSLIPSMIMHALNNFGALTLVTVLGKDLF